MHTPPLWSWTLIWLVHTLSQLPCLLCPALTVLDCLGQLLAQILGKDSWPCWTAESEVLLCCLLLLLLLLLMLLLLRGLLVLETLSQAAAAWERAGVCGRGAC